MMKRVLLMGLAMAVLVGFSLAQTTPPTSDAAPVTQNSLGLPAGTIVAVELAKSLDARKVKVGDLIESKVPADVLLHGKIVVPRDTKVVGHVTDVKANSKESPGAKVGIAFDRMVMKKGGEIPLQLVVQAVGRPLQLVDYPDQMNQGSGAPAGSASTAGGAGAATSNPSRAQERVAAIPINGAGLDSDTAPPTTMAPLGPTSKGVVGIKGLTLENSGPASVISAEKDNVHLDTGAQMILRVQ
jgi:hypothetical protein